MKKRISNLIIIFINYIKRNNSGIVKFSKYNQDKKAEIETLNIKNINESYLILNMEDFKRLSKNIIKKMNRYCYYLCNRCCL